MDVAAADRRQMVVNAELGFVVVALGVPKQEAGLVGGRWSFLVLVCA